MVWFSLAGIYTTTTPDLLPRPHSGSRTYIYEDIDDVVVGQPPWPYNDADTPGVRTRFTACQAAIDYNTALAGRRRAELLADAAAAPAAATPAAANGNGNGNAKEVFRGGPKDNAGGGGIHGGAKEMFRGGPKDNVGAAAGSSGSGNGGGSGGRRLLAKAPPPRHSGGTAAAATTAAAAAATTLPTETQQPADTEGLVPLGALGSLDGGSSSNTTGGTATATDAAAGSGTDGDDDGDVQARGNM